MQSFECSPREYPYLCVRHTDFVYLNYVFLFPIIHSFLMKLIFFVSACYYKNVFEQSTLENFHGEKWKKKKYLSAMQITMSVLIHNKHP